MSRHIQCRRAYETICALHQEKGYETASLCALAGIPRSSYYKWLNRETCASEKENTLLLEELIRLYSEVNGIYGYRRMTMNVNSRLKRNYNRKRIYRLMKSVHMQAVIRRKKKHYIISEPRVTAENVLNREFTADRPNEKWLTQPVHIPVQRMAVYIQRRTDIAMAQPHPNVLGITAALAQSIHSGMAQVMEPDDLKIGLLQLPSKMMGYKILVNGRTIFLNTGITAIHIITAQKLLIRFLALFSFQKIGPHGTSVKAPSFVPGYRL